MSDNKTTNAVAYEEIDVADTAIGFTAALLKSSLPEKITKVRCTLETANIRYRYDGNDPTSVVGHTWKTGDIIILTGISDIRRFRMIRKTSTSGKVQATFEN